MNLLIFLFFFLHQNYANLVKGGDFEFYKGTFKAAPCFLFQFLPSNRSGWFASNQGIIQIINMHTPAITTNSIELSAFMPYEVCQNIRLSPAIKYQMSYSLYTRDTLHKMLLTVTIDGINISSLYIQSANRFGNQISYFFGPKPLGYQNLLCFSQVHEPLPAYANSLWINGSGGILDNISIIQTQQYWIQFQIHLLENISEIILVSNFTYNQTIAIQLQRQFVLKVQGFKLAEFSCLQNQDGNLIISTTSNISFRATDLVFDYKNGQESDYFVNFNLTISSRDDYFYMLDYADKQVLNFSSSSIIATLKVASTIIYYMKLIFCSYYAFTLISFDSLSLFYIFLNIRAVPAFTKNTYYELIGIEYSSSSFTQAIQRIFNLHTSLFILNSEIQNIPEHIQDRQDGQIWFGQFGFSSLVLLNNIDNFMVLLLIMIKTSLLKIIFNCFDHKIKRRFKIKSTRFIAVIIIEFLGMTPVLIVSAVARLMQSCVFYGEAIQKSIQIFLLFLSLIVIGIFLVEKLRGQKRSLNLKKIHKNKVKDKAQIKNIKRSKKIKTKPFIQVADTYLCFTIPFLAALQSPKLFLTANSFVIAIKLGFFIKFQAKPMIRKIIPGFIILVWIIHHAIFIRFFIISQSSTKHFSQMQVEIVVLGLSSILAVLCGVCLQIIKFFICLLKILGFMVTTLVNCCRNSRLKPQRQRKMYQKSKKYQQKHNFEDKNQANILKIKNHAIHRKEDIINQKLTLADKRLKINFKVKS